MKVSMRADFCEIIARAMEAVVQWTGSSELQNDIWREGQERQ